LAATHDKVLALIAARSATRVIISTDGDIEGAYAELLTGLRADLFRHEPIGARRPTELAIGLR